MRTDNPEWTVPIARWAVCEASVGEDGVALAPDVSFVEPMLRRRLSTLARMSLRVAHDCAQDIPDVRFVYASRHGELARTTAMLGDLAEGQDLSPTAFSMSVLNASAGLFSIIERNSAPATAISACAASFGYGLLEACLQLADHPDQPVLLVYADEPIPAVYDQPELSRLTAHAVGVLLQSGASMQLSCRITAGDEVISDEAQSRAFLRGLATGNAAWQGDGARWAWRTQ